MNERLISEPIQPVPSETGFEPFVVGEPILPERFVWRGEEEVVAEILERWKGTSEGTAAMSEEYVRRHWYRIRTVSGKEMKIYFERQARSQSGRKQRWWLFSVMALLAWALLPTLFAIERALAAPWVPAALSDSLGSDLDRAERDAYHLFPDIAGFERARFSADGSSYRVEYSFHDGSQSRTKSAGIGKQAWEVTKLHVDLVERHRALSAARPSLEESELQYRLALRFAAEARYDVSGPLLEDLGRRYPESPIAVDARSASVAVGRIAGSERGLYLPGTLYDPSGRTDLLVFAGYYGIWTGIAVPIFLGSEDPKAFAAGLLIAPTASLLIASGLSKNSEIGVGRALMISLGGNLGTWQGIGWSAVSDAEGDVVGIGLLCGLAGIAAATALTHEAHFSEGHGALTNSSLLWGAWFGLVGGIVAGAEDDDLLKASLVGTDAIVLGTAIASRNVQMSKSRVRLISLMGVVGTAFGFGIVLLTDSGSTSTEAAFGIAGAGSILGLAVGANITKNHDRGKTFSEAGIGDAESRLSLRPSFRIDGERGRAKKVVPTLAVHLSF